MNQALIQALQKMNDIQSTYLGILQYLDKHSSKFGQVLTEISEAINEGSTYMLLTDPDDAIVLKSGTSAASEKWYAKIASIKTALDSFFASDTNDASEVLLEVYSTDTQSTLTVPLDKAIDMMSDAYAEEQALSLTILGMLDVVRGTCEDLFTAVNNKLASANIKSTIKDEVISAISSISTTYGGITSNNIKPLTSVVFQIFGFKRGEAALVEPEIGTYYGVNALTTVLSSFANTMSAFISDLPTKMGNAIAMLAGGLQYVYLAGAAKVGSWIAKEWNTVTGARDSFLYSKKGDGAFVLDCAYLYPRTLGSWQLQYLDNAFGSLSTTQIAAYYPTGTMLIQKTDAGYLLNFIPKVINDGVVLLALNKYFGVTADYWLPWKQQGADKITRTAHELPSFNATQSIILNFLDDIFSSDQLYLTGDDANDSCLATSVMSTKVIHHLLVSLYDAAVNDTDVSGSWLHDTLLEGTRTICVAPITSRFGTSPTVNNALMGIIVGSLQEGNTAFQAWSNSGQTENVVDVNASYNAYFINWFANMAHYVWAPTSIENGNGLFSPYSTSIVLPKASWTLPTDQSNVESMTAYLLRSGITVGAIVAAIVAIVVFKKIRGYLFALNATAGEMSWRASANNDSQLMAEAFRLNKRARLLGLLLGQSGAIVGSSMTVSNESSLIRAVGKKIDPSF